MNSIVKIKRSLYESAAELYCNANPEKGAYLTERPEGQAYFFTKYSGYAVLYEVRPGVTEIRGAFKTGNEPGFAEAVVRWARALGANTVQLNCFMPAAKAWAEAGLLTYALSPWNTRHAPSGWKEEYGTPSVLFMRRHFGG